MDTIQDEVEVYKGLHLLKNDSHFTKWVKESHGQIHHPFGSLYMPAGRIIDIGAYVGLYTRIFEKKTDGLGTVHAFEPNPLAYSCLTRNIQSITTRTYPVALGSKVDVADFTIYRPNYGASYINPNPDQKLPPNVSSIKVPVMPLDLFEIQGVDFIKIDAEGFEYEILCGAKETISNSHRPMLYVEVQKYWLARNGSSPADLKKIIESMGYSIVKEDKHGNDDQYDWWCE